MAVVAAQMAMADAGWREGHVDPARVGVVVGATGTGYAPCDGDTDQHRILKNMASASAAWISLKGKYLGPSFVVSTACSSGAYALHAAHLLLASGQCDVVITGAACSDINYLDVEGFSSLLALSECGADFETASRPFDKNRCGFVIGEGAGMLVLESREAAARRGARVYATMALPGLSCEAYNIISPEPGGRSMAISMDLALRQAGLTPADIDYINAHGTSTPLNDLYETQAIKSVFGARAKSVPVSATKSMTGHCLSAAAAVEAVICCQAIRAGAIPPTANLHAPDPELDLDFVPLHARYLPIRHALSNSFAFGGHNGVCIFSQPD
jgi:3-oxoacyl-[acyl-carrier-protein] synthase II